MGFSPHPAPYPVGFDRGRLIRERFPDVTAERDVNMQTGFNVPPRGPYS